MKNIKFLILIVSIIFVLCGCVGQLAKEYHPTNFSDTIWATEDNSVVIEVGDQLSHRGYITVNGEAQQLFFEMRITGIDIQGFTSEQMEDDYSTSTESWEIIPDSYEKDKMVVKIKKSEHFNVGDTLAFYNKGKNTSNDNNIDVNKAIEIAAEKLPEKEFEQHVRYNRLEKINEKDYYILYAYAQNLKTVVNNNSTIESVEEVKTCWIYLDAITGELYNLKELEYEKINPPLFE